MNTYILRDPKAVEPQNRSPNPLPPLRPDPVFTVTLPVLSGGNKEPMFANLKEAGSGGRV